MRWTLIVGTFLAGLGMSVAGFVRGGEGLACKVSGQLFCASDPLAEELLYGGLALISVALLSAVATLSRAARTP